MAATPTGALSPAGAWVALELAAPATPPVEELGLVPCAAGCASSGGLTWPLGLVVVGAGVPALVWAPLPTWFAGVVGLTGGGVCVWLEVWAVAVSAIASAKLSR